MDSPRPSRTGTVTVADTTEWSAQEGGSSPSIPQVQGASTDQIRQQWTPPALQKVGSVAEATLQSFT